MLENSGYRMQVVSPVSGALQLGLFHGIRFHGGMKSLDDILEKPVTSNKVPDMFCRDFYRDFGLSMLKAMAARHRFVSQTIFDLSKRISICNKWSQLRGRETESMRPILVSSP